MKTNLKKVLSCMLAVIMLICAVPLGGLGSVVSFAEGYGEVVKQGSCGADGDNVTWALYDDGTLVISGEGDMEDYEDESPWAYNSSITKIVIEEGITGIGDCAFSECDEIESVIMPASVKNISVSAFYNCQNLTDVYYYGSEDQWNEIFDEGDNEPLFNATIHYNYVPCLHENVTSSEAKDATCTEDGYTAGTYCNDCEQWISGHEIIKASHTDENADGVCDVCKSSMNDISVGETKTIEIFSNEITYLRFCPAISGTYTFSSLSDDDDDDTYGHLYDADKNELSSDDDGGSSCNFSITYNLEKGKIYYWGAHYFTSSKSGSFDVKLVCDEVFCKHENTTSSDATEATCTENGYTAGTYCNDCEQWISGHEIIKASHTDENADGVCDVCGEPAPIKSGYCGYYYDEETNEETFYGENVKYELYNDGTLVISGTGEMGYWNIDSENFPPYVNYETQTDEWGNEYYTDTTITKLIIEDGITKISSCSFYGLQNLSSVSIGNDVEFIGYCAFARCTSLESITVPENVIEIGSSVFSGCTNLKEINISDTIEEIGSYFAENTAWYDNLPNGVIYVGKLVDGFKGSCYGEVLEIKDGTKEIMPNSLQGCGANSIIIPDSVTKIGDFSLPEECLESIYVDENNEYYSSDNGVLYNKDKTCLVGVPSAYSEAQFVIPESVEKINMGAFYKCANLVSVSIPDNVEKIDYCTFMYCYALKSITLPKNLEYIGSYAFEACKLLESIVLQSDINNISNDAFRDCSNLKHVYYAGSEEQWNEIDIEDGNDCLTDADIQYYYGMCKHENTTSSDATEATCTSDGYTAGTYCLDCETWISGHEVVPATNHANKYTVVKQNATCTTDGYTAGTYCPDCGTWISGHEVVPATNHANKYAVAEQNATCTSDGYTEGTYCPDCGTWISGHEKIAKLSHSYTSKVTKAATCTEDGIKTFTCSCGDTYTETIKAAGHKEVKIPAVSATCTKTGLTEGKKCSVCGTVTVNQKTVDKTPHNEVTIPAKAATYTSTGLTEGKKCSVCSTVTVAQKTVAKLSSTNVSKLSVKVSAASIVCTGKALKPAVTVKNGSTTLKLGTHYTVSYKNNTKVGTATITISGIEKNGYTGTKNVTFNIVPAKVTGIKATPDKNAVKLSWKKAVGASSYVVYKVVNGKYTKVATTTKTSVTVKNLKAGTKCNFVVMSTATVNKKAFNGAKSAVIGTATKPNTPTLNVKLGSKKATLSWNKQTCTGYEIYMATSKNGKYKKVSTVKNSATLKYTKTGLTKGKTYYFKVRSYVTNGKTTVYGGYSKVQSVKVK